MIQIDDKMVIVGVDLGFQFVKTRNYVFEKIGRASCRERV